jgi:hypothetical protein
MKVTLTASTAAKIVVWKEDDLYHARRIELPAQTQVCLEVDLFEVIAELAELDLEQPAQAAEATELSECALAQLAEDGAGPHRSRAVAWDEDQSGECESAP